MLVVEAINASHMLHHGRPTAVIPVIFFQILG
jgi:hypothetical protein